MLEGSIIDIYSKKKRSQIMSKIKGVETKPEIVIRKYLFSKGFRYLINDKRYPGKPDIVIPKYHTIIFVNGCFWHSHVDCKASKLPKTNVAFWTDKIKKNKERDQRNIDKLEKDGWNVIVVWQCELKNINEREQRLKTLVDELLGHDSKLKRESN